MSEVNGMVIPEGVKLTGDIESEKPVAVSGHLVGNVASELAVAITGVVEGDVNTKNAGLKEGAVVKGNVTCSNKLIVEEGCEIEGCVKANVVTLRGSVKGDIDTAELDIAASAKVVGNITAGALSVEKGAGLVCQSVRLGQPEEVQDEHVDEDEVEMLDMADDTDEEDAEEEVEEDIVELTQEEEEDTNG